MEAGVPRLTKKTAIEEVASPRSISKAWSDVSGGKLKSQKALRRGIDGDSLVQFSTNLSARVAGISKAISAQRYVFSPLQPFFIPKPGSTKERLICVPTVEDRVVQRAILNFLRGRTPWLDNGISFGFVPTLGVKDAVQHAIKLRGEFPWVFKTDITAFFDKVDRDIVASAIAQKIKQPTLRPLLLAAMKTEVEPMRASQSAKIKLQGIIEGVGVRQGMPLSPLFANMVLHPFDLACAKLKIPAVRYADDLIFFAKSQSEAEKLQTFCKDELSQLKLNIPELGAGSKSQIYEPSQTADFLGVEFAMNSRSGYEIRVGKKQTDIIRTKILSLGNLTELKNRKLDITRFGNALSASTAAYKAHYSFCSNIADLSNNVDAWRKKAFSAVYTQLGIDPKVLNEDARWFLALD